MAASRVKSFVVQCQHSGTEWRLNEWCRKDGRDLNNRSVTQRSDGSCVRDYAPAVNRSCRPIKAVRV